MGHRCATGLPSRVLASFVGSVEVLGVCRVSAPYCREKVLTQKRFLRRFVARPRMPMR